MAARPGVFVNAASDWARATRSRALDSFFRAQAVSILNHAIRSAGDQPGRCQTPQSCQFAFSWTGTARASELGATLGGQESAIDALASALP